MKILKPLKTLFLLTTFSSLFFVACSSFTIRQDPAPAPIDPQIAETRLEFTGCGVESSVGNLVCKPTQEASVVTEFLGDVIYFSSGAGCSIREQVRATPPLTKLNLPETKELCPVIVYYLPEYPNFSKSTYKLNGLFGEIELDPDPKYLAGGTFSISTAEILTLKFPEAVRGAYFSRQLTAPVSFDGNVLNITPKAVGTDYVQVKIWKADGTNEYYGYSGNYYSPYALNLLFDFIQPMDNSTTPPTKKPYFYLNFPGTVTAVTINGKISNALSIKLASTFTGFVRAYTVQGRSVVAKFDKGVQLWIK